jgi:hypothetical protein
MAHDYCPGCWDKDDCEDCKDEKKYIKQAMEEIEKENRRADIEGTCIAIVGAILYCGGAACLGLFLRGLY